MFDHYIAVDWAKTNMAIARLTKESKTPRVVDVQASLDELKVYPKQLRGTKSLTIEDTILQRSPRDDRTSLRAVCDS
jgi:hypothetical protein